MIITEDKEQKIKRAIRDVIALDPLISVDNLRQALAKKNFRTASGEPLTWHYIAKLVRKVNRETATEVSRQVTDERVAKIKERYRLAMDQLLKIAFYSKEMQEQGMPPPTYKERISAIREILKWDIAIFQAEMDAGVFERKLGTLEIERRSAPLPPELKAAIIGAMRQWGLPVPAGTLPAPKEHDEPKPTNTNTRT